MTMLTYNADNCNANDEMKLYSCFSIYKSSFHTKESIEAKTFKCFVSKMADDDDENVYNIFVFRSLIYSQIPIFIRLNCICILHTYRL